MKIAFNPSTVAALTTPPNNKDITFDLRGRNIFARGVKFYGTDTNTWRDIKINNVSIGSNILDLRNGSNTTLTNTNGVVTINSTWRPVVDNLTSDSTTSSLSAKQGKVLKALIDGKSNSDHNHDGRYLKLTGGTMASNALITFADSGSWGTDKGPQGARGGLYWTGQSDYAKLYAEETVGDNLDLVIQFGDDNSNGLSIRNKANTQTSYISSSGVITTGTFKGNLDWSYITNKPLSYTPSAHTHAWNSLTHSSTTENQAILTNGKANGWKLQTLNIARWDNAANNAHSHANKSVLDGITSALVNSWNTAYNFVSNITGTDTDKVINKWEEIVNFLAGITEDNKLNTLLNNKLSVYELADKTNVGTIKNNGIYYSTTDASSGTLTNSPFNTGFALINMTSYDGGDDLRRSRLAFNAYGEIKVSDDRDQANTAETWYNILTSKNSGINGSTIKLNGTSITVYSSGTADGRYVKKSGDTMSGVLTIDTTNFGALTIKRNDDAYGASIQFRGKSSVYGYIGLNNSTKDKQFLRWSSDTSRVYTILDTSSTYISNGKGVINGTTITQVDNATNSTNSTNARKLVNWYSARPTSLNAQFGDGSLRIFYATSSTTEGKSPSDAAVLHLAWDNNGGWDSQLAISNSQNRVYSRSQNAGTWQPWKTLAFTTDIPSSLKNPYSFNVFGVVYDGSAAKTVTTSTFVSQLPEGASTVTDGTMFITSWASNSGFADTNAVNVPYKRKAIHLWEYIKAKTDSLYATKGHNHDGKYLRLSGQDTMQGNLYLHSHGTSYIGKGLGDKSGADFTEANIVIRSWWGISFKSYDDIVRTYIDTRTGNIGTKGVLNAVGAVIQGRVYNGGDDEGIIINPAPNGYAGLILGTHNGERSVFYLKKGNPFWRYNNGSTNLDIYHPKKSGTIALTSDIPSKDSWNYDDRYLRLTGGQMSGNINFGGDNEIHWGRNTDSASISFKNDGDGDANSYMSFVTSDNGNEYFRWSHSSGSTNTEWMALRSDGLRVRGTKVSLEGHSHNDLYYTKAESNAKYITDITTSVNKLTFTRNGSNIIRDITVNVVHSQGYLPNIPNKDATTKANPGLLIYNSYNQTIGTNPYSSVLSINTGGTIQIAGNWGDNYTRNLYWRSQSDRNVADYPWNSWRTILDSENYSSTLDSRYYTESEVNSLLDAKLNRQNLSYGTWNPRGYHLAADYHYNGGDLSISENNGKMYVSVDGCFWQNEGQYRVLDTSDIGDIRDSVTLHQYLGATDAAWYPLVWGGASHNNTSDSTGAVYKSYDKLSWQTSSQTLYATHLRTTYIDLENNRGISQVTSGGTSPYKGIRLPDLQSNGIGMFSKIGSGDDADEGGIIISADTSVIYNSFDIGWGLTVRDKDRGQTDISGDGTIAFGVRQDYRAYSLGGFEKSGSDNTYVLLGGGDHKLESSLNVAYSKYLTGIALTGGHNNDEGYRLIFEKTMGGWNINYGVWAIAFRHSGRGTLNIGFDTTNSDGSTYIYDIRFLGSTASRESTPFRAFYNSTTKVFRIYWHYVDYTSGDIAVLRGNMEPHNGTWMTSLPNDIGTELAITYNMADQAVNADTVDGVHINWSGTNDNPIYLASWDNNGKAIRAATRANISVGYATSATKLQTPRTIWGQSFDGTRDVSGTLSGVANIQFSADNAYDIGSNGVASRYIYTNWLGARSGRKLELGANNSEFGKGLCIDTNLNVGIGTNSPAYKLHVNGTFRATNSTVSDLFVNTGDATLKIYTGITADAQNDGNICFQTSIDATDGQSHAYPTQYQNRCNIVLQPRGGQVYIGTNPGTGNTTYKLYVNSKIFSNGGFVKNGSSDSYVLLGGGGHTLLSSLNGSHNHDGRYVRAFGTSNDNIDSDWGQSFKTFDPVPLGTPPENNPNISLLSIGENFNRRKQLAFIWNNDNIYYRRRIDSSFTNWRRLAFTDSKVADSDKLDGVHLNGIFTGFSYAQSRLTATIGTVSKTVNVTGSYPSIGGVTMNTIASYGNCMGMADLASSNSNVNPNNQTSWHHFINMSYNTESTNMWQTQFAIKAGTTEVWVRSRAGGSISDSSAWAAPWVRLARITDNIASATNADMVDGEHASNFSYTHQTSFDFSKGKSGRIVTFDQSNTNYGWINGFASTHNNYLTSVIFNTHRTSNWYVGYMEGNRSTGKTNGLQAVHKLAFADGDENYPIFLGYLHLYNGNDGTISGSFPCLGYSVPFTYTRGGAYCLINIPNTSFQTFYIKAAIASVHYSGAGMGHWVGNHRGDGAWWLHCDAVGSNAVQVKGFHLANENNDSWWGGNPLYSGDGAAKIITVCLFGYVKFR